MENGKKVMMDFLQTQNDYITYLMEAFEVPETLESEYYLLKLVLCSEVNKFVFVISNLR